MSQESKPSSPQSTHNVQLYSSNGALKDVVTQIQASEVDMSVEHPEVEAIINTHAAADPRPEAKIEANNSADLNIYERYEALSSSAIFDKSDELQEVTPRSLNNIYTPSRPRPSFLPPQESLSGTLAPQPKVEERLLELEASVAQQERQIEGLLNIASNLRQSTKSEEAMQSIVVQISQLLGADRTTIYEVSEDGQMLNGLAVQSQVSIRVMIESGRGLAGLVAKEKRVINLRDAYEHPNFDVRVDRHTGYRTRSVLCVPMFGASGEVIGVVQVLNKLTGTFSKEDQHLLCALAAQAAITLEALRLEFAIGESNKNLRHAKEQLSHKLEEQELLFEIEKSLLNTSDLSELAEFVLTRSASVVRSEHVGLFVVNAEDHGPAYLKSAGSDHLTLRKNVTLGEGIMGKVASRGEDFILVNDSFEREVIPRALWDRCDIEVNNAFAASLYDGTRVLGALVFVNCDVLNKHSEGLDDHQDHDESDNTSLDQTYDEDDSKSDEMHTLAERGGSYSHFDAVQIRAEVDALEDRLRGLRFVSLIARQLGRGISTLMRRQEEEQRSRLMSIGQMLSGVLHDLKGPMTSIRGYTQLLSRSDDAELRERLAQTVLNKIGVFNEMTSDIIAFARGDRRVLWRKVFLSHFVESVLESVKFEYDEHGVTIEVDQQAGAVAYFDEGKMRRVVVNIARNARQALGQSGHFKWTLSRDDQRLIFTLTDNGPGIPLAIRDRVFELFSTMGKEEGTGLGLAIVRQIVDDHEGTIELHTDTGEGTTFTISIPQAERNGSS
jgi:signal transduction histidine kinase/putative methionine-R-sulfoxide reductase with GAF domain